MDGAVGECVGVRGDLGESVGGRGDGAVGVFVCGRGDDVVGECVGGRGEGAIGECVGGRVVGVSGGFVGGRGDGAFGGCVGGRRGDAVGEFVVGQGVVTFVGETSPLLSGVEGEGANVTSEVEGQEACAETLVSERELSEAVALPFIPRGRSVACHECGRPSVRLKLDGRLYKHKVPGMAGVCQASGRLPTLVEASVSAPAGTNLFSQPDSHAPNVIQQAMPPIFLDRILGRVGFLRPIRRIPKAARSAVAVLLTSTIHRVCNNTEDEDAWFDLFSFQERVLSLPAENQLARRHRRGHNRPRCGPSVPRTPLAEIIRNAAATFRTSAVASNATSFISRPRVKPNAAIEGKSLAPLIASKIDDGDVRAALHIATSSDSVAPVSEEVLASLVSKHPEGPPIPLPHLPEVIAPPANVSVAEVKAGISSFSNGSAGGIDGIRAIHLKDLTAESVGVSGVRLIDALVRLCDIILSGIVPSAVRPVFFGGRLTALRKKCGGIRPIAVGSTLRRLAAKILCRRLRPLGGVLAPTQLGFAVRSGCEAAIHATRGYCSSASCSSAGEPQVLLKVDFANAFNSIFRDVILEETYSSAPMAATYAYQAYGAPSALRFGDHIVWSKNGIQQGDPLEPLLFSLGLRRLTAALPTTPLSVWYLDDGTLGGPISLVKEAFDRVVSVAGSIGMTVNVAKTEVCLISGSMDVVSICATFGGAKVIPYPKLELLGSPIGPTDSPDQLSRSVEIRLEQIATFGQRLQDLCSHHRLFLLKHCVGVPRLLYLIRSSPCFLAPEALRNIDALFRQSLTETLNVRLDDKAWDQASLPVKAGGLGVRRIEDLALPAYLSSSSAAKALVLQIAPSAAEPFGLLFSAALEAWSVSAGNEVDPPIQPSASLQSSWDTPLVTHALKNLLSRASDQDALRLRSVSAEDVGGSEWLGAYPSSVCGTLLTDEEIRIAVGLRIGAPIVSPHLCVDCGAAVTASEPTGSLALRAAVASPATRT